MLSASQVQSARQSLGINPTQGTSVGAPDRSAELKQAWSSSSGSSGGGYFSDYSKDVSAAGSKIADLASGTQPGETPVVGGLEMAGAAAGAIPTLAADLLPSPARDVAKAALNVPGDVINWLGEKIGGTQAAQDFVNQHPQATDALIQASKAASSAGAIAGTILGAKGTASTLEGAASKAAPALNSISDVISKTPEETSKATPADTSNITDKIRSYFAKDNVDPRLQATAQRLDNPVQAYKDYSQQAQNAVKDVKADPPIATVGENIGNAFDQVVKMRQQVGKTMADQLSGAKDTVIKGVSDVKNQFIDQLTSGLGKMTEFDKSQVGSFLKELRSLGDNPIASKVDDFLSRVPKELDVAKAAKNVTDTTNADRIIKGALSDIRTKMTDTPGLEGYGAARTAYANLSSFLDQGSKYLGSKTASGDYSRDASVVKSAAESILNAGKKDWLIKLEGLTGYKALDDATLAIQAMKDAGDLRGMSLFKSLGEGALHPTSLPFKVLQWGTGKVAGKVLGSQSQQTEAFLKSLSKTSGAPSDTATTESQPQDTAPTK